MDKLEPFNARYLTFEQVASGFIVNRQYQDLSAECHSILMGPRGCGKTTLLKMLAPQSINFWNKKKSENINPPFIGLYIPSDKQWEKQFKLIKRLFPFQDNFAENISRGLVNLNIQIAFLNLFEALDGFESSNRNFEFDLSQELISVWDLKESTAAFYYDVKKELRAKVKTLNNKVNRVIDTKGTLRSQDKIELPSFCFDDYMDIIEMTCDAFEVINKKHGLFRKKVKWALCFDELEIAPKWLQTDLIRNKLRSSTQRFLFKLTTSPLIDVTRDPDSLPTPDGDFNIILNWNHDVHSENAWKDFSKELIESKLKDHVLEFDVKDLFGEWDYEKALDYEIRRNYKPDHKVPHLDKLGGWGKNSIMWYIINRLAEIDDSFKDFLIAKKIDPINPEPISKGMVDKIHRKIKPLVIFRFYHRGITGLRSRKRVFLFHGFEFIQKFSDGNPRTLINILNEFIPHVKRFNTPKKKKTKAIPIGIQADIFEKLSEKKLDDIKNYPDATIRTSTRFLSLGDILKTIGDYFFEQQTINDFTMDPVGTFVIDKNVSPKIVELLELGLELGAIQDISNNDRVFVSELINNRYRFSYALYPTIGIPIRIDRGANLSSILSQVYKDFQTTIDYED